MELKITEQFKSDENFNYSGSAIEHGHNVGQITWNNACNSGLQYVTEENREEILEYFLDYGAWEKEEIDSIEDLNGLCVQEIASQIRDFEDLCDSDWEAYEELSNQGTIQGLIFKGIDNEIYAYLGS